MDIAPHLTESKTDSYGSQYKNIIISKLHKLINASIL